MLPGNKIDIIASCFFNRAMKRTVFCFISFLSATSATSFAADFDVIIKGGAVYDGTGGEAQQVDLGIKGDRIAGLGDFKNASAKTIVNASGLVVAPGFINMLSWSTESLIQDGRSQSEIRQGVTTEIMGEGESMGPVNDRVREHMLSTQTDIKYEIKWNTLAEYLQFLEKRGISCNVASFIGATTIRENVIGFDDRAPTPQELDQMRELVRKEMEDLSARVLRQDGRIGRALQSCGQVQGQIHLAHAKRRKPIVRSVRRAGAHRARSEHSGRGLSHQSRRPKQLAESGRASFPN